jgi:hypothetical protein
MSCLVRHILTLSAALLLVLPPGWCCLAPRARASARASARLAAEPGCCHGCPTHPDHGTAPERDEAPVAPNTNCCCVTDATAPTDPETPAADSASAPLVVLVADLALPPVVHRFTRDSQFHVLSPPPRLLHCVWLC